MGISFANVGAAAAGLSHGLQTGQKMKAAQQQMDAIKKAETRADMHSQLMMAIMSGDTSKLKTVYDHFGMIDPTTKAKATDRLINPQLAGADKPDNIDAGGGFNAGTGTVAGPGPYNYADAGIDMPRDM